MSKFYRFELAFDGQPQGVGFLQGLEDTGLGLRWTALSASWMRSTGSSLVTSWKMTLQMLSITMSVRLRLTGSTSIPALPVIPFPAWLRFGERRKFIERENAYQSICR